MHFIHQNISPKHVIVVKLTMGIGEWFTHVFPSTKEGNTKKLTGIKGLRIGIDFSIWLRLHIIASTNDDYVQWFHMKPFAHLTRWFLISRAVPMLSFAINQPFFFVCDGVEPIMKKVARHKRDDDANASREKLNKLFQEAATTDGCLSRPFSNKKNQKDSIMVRLSSILCLPSFPIAH